MTPTFKAMNTHLITPELPLEVIAGWVTLAAPEDFWKMYRKRLVHFHNGEAFESLTLYQLLEHLEMVEWGYSNGARPEQP